MTASKSHQLNYYRINHFSSTSPYITKFSAKSAQLLTLKPIIMNLGDRKIDLNLI